MIVISMGTPVGIKKSTDNETGINISLYARITVSPDTIN
jgi:hypothetical protein